jgi:hypothetical protein
MTDARFFIDHGVIHDRVTGKHVTTDGQPPFEDSVEQVCELLNSLSENRVTIWQQKAIEIATKVDEALALVPQSEDGVEVAAGDMLFLAPDISNLLREIAGMPAL